MGVVYYISSILNILKFRRRVVPKPDTWYGPYNTKKQAESMRDFINTNVNKKKSDEKIKINRGGF